MTESGYRIAEAVDVLLGQGLLTGLHLPLGQGFLAADEAAARTAGLPGEFLGAGLDNRELAPGGLFVALAGEHADGRRFAPGALAKGHWVLTRKVDGPDDLAGLQAPAGVLLSADPEAALAALAAAWRDRFDLPLVGVTGSNGKTTTKDLLTALLAAAGPVWATRGNLNNRLGLPLTLLGLRREHRFAVIEMGASAVGHIAYLASLARPTVAVITNAGQAHLAEFGSLAGVVQGKGEILDLLPATGRAILNTDSPGFAEWAERAPCPVLSFGRSEGDFLHAWNPDGGDGRPVLTMAGESWPVPLPGEHNGANLAAALAAGLALGVPPEQLRAGLASFRPSEHRSSLLDIAGRTVLDDAYNANPVSMAAAGRALARLGGRGRTLAVLGHMAELGSGSEDLHRDTGRQLAADGLDALLAVGPAAAPLAEGFAAAGGEASRCADLEEAAAWVADRSRPGDRILVKGSRSAGMEQLVPLLERILAPEDEKQ